MDNTKDSGFNESNMTIDETLNITTYDNVAGDNSLNSVSILSVFESPFWNDNYTRTENNSNIADVSLPLFKTSFWDIIGDNDVNNDNHREVIALSNADISLPIATTSFSDDPHMIGLHTGDDWSVRNEDDIIPNESIRYSLSGRNILDTLRITDTKEMTPDKSSPYSMSSRNILETLKMRASKCTQNSNNNFKGTIKSSMRQHTKLILKKMKLVKK